MADGSGHPTALKLRGSLVHLAVRQERRHRGSDPDWDLTPRDGGDPGREESLPLAPSSGPRGGVDETLRRREHAVS